MQTSVGKNRDKKRGVAAESRVGIIVLRNSVKKKQCNRSYSTSDICDQYNDAA